MTEHLNDFCFQLKLKLGNFTCPCRIQHGTNNQASAYFKPWLCCRISSFSILLNTTVINSIIYIYTLPPKNDPYFFSNFVYTLNDWSYLQQHGPHYHFHNVWDYLSWCKAVVLFQKSLVSVPSHLDHNLYLLYNIKKNINCF